MPRRIDTINTLLSLKINNKAVPATVIKQIVMLEVTDTLRQPAHFNIQLDLGNDTARVFTIADQLISRHFSPGNEIKIYSRQGRKQHLLLLGRIASVGLDLDSSEAESRHLLQVQGDDKAQLLCNGQQRRVFQDMKYSDVAADLAGAVGLSISAHNSGQIFPYLVQANQSDWDYLWQLANRIGFEVYVVENQLHFKRPGSRGRVTLSWGKGLVQFNTLLLQSRQSSEVTVRGWDPQAKQPISATATSLSGQSRSRRPIRTTKRLSLASQTRVVVVDKVLHTESEAERMAEALADNITRHAAVACGVVNPGAYRLRTGAMVSINGVGKHLSQQYYVTTSVHSFTPESGYETHFEVGNQRFQHDYSTIPGQEEQQNALPTGMAVIGVVINNQDPDGLSRIKVRFPWLDGQLESAWARIAMPMAGPERGTYFIPEVDDEVLIVFEQGDPNHPYIVGSLWNGVDLPPESDGEDSNNWRFLKSRSGHIVRLDDTVGQEKIEIIDQSEGNRIVIDSANNTITVDAADTVNINAQAGKLNLSGKEIELLSETDLKIQANNIDIRAAMNLELHGFSTRVNSDINTDIESTNVNVNGSGIVTVNGSLVRIN